MAGRRRLRRGSDSTVATIDEHTLHYTKESQIIQAASGANLDDWPCFLLTEAAVYDKHGRMANLLHVDLEGPFMIRGNLVVEPDQSSYLIRGYKSTRSTWIEIPRTYAYSIGLKEDSGTPVVWAAGEAAHFELIPSERYAPIANVMFQGIIMHYTILDLYDAELEALKERDQPNSRQHKKRKYRLQDVKLPLNDILYRYAAAVGDGSTLEEVVQRCKDQAGFLLAQFPKDTEFHAWLSGQFPDIVQQLKKKPNPAATIAFTEPELPAPKAPSVHTKSSSLESKGRAKAAPKSSASIGSRAAAKANVDLVESGSDGQRASRSRSFKVQRQSPSKPRQKREASELADVNMQDFAPHPVALPERTKPEVLQSANPNPQSALLALIDVLEEERQKFFEAWNTGAKQKKHPDTVAVNGWLTKMYMAMSITNYSAKAEILQYHAAGLAEQLGPDWHNSELYKWAKQNVDVKPQYEFITEENIWRIQRRQRNPNGQAQKSAQKAPIETSGKQPPRGRPSGKAAGLRPSLGSKKRPRSPDGDEDEMDLGEEFLARRKTAKTSQYFTEGENEEADSSASSDVEDGENKAVEPLTRVIIHAEPLPETQPKGPNHTWTCEEPDCGYVVRSAHEKQGQEAIREHYEMHEKEASDEAKERELIAMQESRGLLPINHLLDKIRKANSAASKTNPEEINGRVVPQPVKRSLLV